jgi:hypothetical protein
MEASEAYQTLLDPDRRAAYDRENSLRRLNFFRDVDVSGRRAALGLRLRLRLGLGLRLGLELQGADSFGGTWAPCQARAAAAAAAAAAS